MKVERFRLATALSLGISATLTGCALRLLPPAATAVPTPDTKAVARAYLTQYYANQIGDQAAYMQTPIAQVTNYMDAVDFVRCVQQHSFDHQADGSFKYLTGDFEACENEALQRGAIERLDASNATAAARNTIEAPTVEAISTAQRATQIPALTATAEAAATVNAPGIATFAAQHATEIAQLTAEVPITATSAARAATVAAAETIEAPATATAAPKATATAEALRAAATRQAADAISTVVRARGEATLAAQNARFLATSQANEATVQAGRVQYDATRAAQQAQFVATSEAASHH
ncbi:MAG TPA: hypothetical protein VIR57_19855 [Chloroflexota bacterium]|jgi:hypothetical protein